MTLPATLTSGYRTAISLANPSGVDPSKHSLSLVIGNHLDVACYELGYDADTNAWSVSALIRLSPGQYQATFQIIDRMTGDPTGDAGQSAVTITPNPALGPLEAARSRVQAITDAIEALTSNPNASTSLEGLSVTAHNLNDLRAALRDAKRQLASLERKQSGRSSGFIRIPVTA